MDRARSKPERPPDELGEVPFEPAVSVGFSTPVAAPVVARRSAEAVDPLGDTPIAGARDALRALRHGRDQGEPLHGSVAQIAREGPGADISGVRIRTGAAVGRLARSVQSVASSYGADVNSGQGTDSTEHATGALRKIRRQAQTSTTQPTEPGEIVGLAPRGMAPVIRRAILDPTSEDDVFDAEEGKRRARVADMQGGRIGAGDPRKAMLTEHLQGTGRAQGLPKTAGGEPGRVGAQDPRKAMLTEHLQGTGRAKGLQFGGHDMPTQAVGGHRSATISQYLVESGRVSIAFGAKATTEAQGLGTPVSGGDHSAVEKVAAGHPDQIDAKAKVESEVEKERPKKLLTEGHRYAGTEQSSAEVTLFDEAVAHQDWVEASKRLDQIKALAKDRLDAARVGLEARRSDMSQAMSGLPYRLPTNFRDLGKAVMTAYTNKEWLTVGGLLKELQRIVDTSLDLKVRLDAVRKRAEGLTNSQQQKNVETWLTEYETLPWETVEKNSSFDKGTVAFLEDRVNRYLGDAASAEAATKLYNDRLAAGLISEKGVVIGEKKVEDLDTANGEKGAVQAALDGLDTDTAPTLTHPGGAKWGAPFGNRDGDLPSGTYREYYVQRAPGAAGGYHGCRRLVKSSKGKVYYTWTHYGDNGKPAFVRIR